MTRLSAALSLSAAAGLSACAAAATAPCPPHHERDASREAVLLEHLGRVPLGASLSLELPRTRGICFGADALNVVTHDRTLLISSALPPSEAAARVGHLLVHVRDGLPMRDPIPRDADCEALVNEALDREAVAYVTEVRLQHALGVTPHALAFEFADAIEALDEAAATTLVRSYLAAHPTGAPNIDGLAAGYQQRCLRER